MLIDLHLHTTKSDGVLTPKYLGCMVRAYSRRTGKKVIVVATDHDTVEGQKELLEQVPEATWPEVYAMERTADAHLTFDGERVREHFNVFCPFEFTKDEVPSDVCKAFEWAESNGCILQWNHPFYWPSTKTVLHPARYVATGMECAHVIEVSNANQAFFQDWLTLLGLSWALGEPRVLLPFYFTKVANLLAEKFPVTANTDMHLPFGFLRNANYVPDELVERGWKGFKEAVKQRKLRVAYVKRSPFDYKFLTVGFWRDNGLLLKIASALPMGMNPDVAKAYWQAVLDCHP